MLQKWKKLEDNRYFYVFNSILFVFFLFFLYNFNKRSKLDYKDFTDRKTAFDGFVKYRRVVLNSVDKNKFVDEFTELCTRAMSGDCIAQDCVAYFFNRGVPDYIAPNYEYYMSWQILAGANGNEFALEKLEFFLNSALERIINDEELLSLAMKRKNIDKDNALAVISNLLCEGIVDQLGIEATKLIDINKTPKPYTPERNRVFLDALENCILDVAKFLIS